MKYTVQIDQGLIEIGKPRDAGECPVSLGLFIATGWHWLVENPMCHLDDLEGRASHNFPVDFYLPATVAEWVEEFDQGKPVEPIEFEVDIDEVDYVGDEHECALKLELEQQPAVHLLIAAEAAFSLLQVLQYALYMSYRTLDLRAHPEQFRNRAASCEDVEELAHRLQAAIAEPGSLAAECLQLGWDKIDEVRP